MFSRLCTTTAIVLVAMAAGASQAQEQESSGQKLAEESVRGVLPSRNAAFVPEFTPKEPTAATEETLPAADVDAVPPVVEATPEPKPVVEKAPSTLKQPKGYLPSRNSAFEPAFTPKAVTLPMPADDASGTDEITDGPVEETVIDVPVDVEGVTPVIAPPVPTPVEETAIPASARGDIDPITGVEKSVLESKEQPMTKPVAPAIESTVKGPSAPAQPVVNAPLATTVEHAIEPTEEQVSEPDIPVVDAPKEVMNDAVEEEIPAAEQSVVNDPAAQPEVQSKKINSKPVGTPASVEPAQQVLEKTVEPAPSAPELATQQLGSQSPTKQATSITEPTIVKSVVTDTTTKQPSTDTPEEQNLKPENMEQKNPAPTTSQPVEQPTTQPTARPAQQPEPTQQPQPKRLPSKASAIFAGGCFWCMEPPFDATAGVLKTTSGYTGGDARTADYKTVSAGGTGHYEAVEVVYDPRRVSYQELLEIYWANVDALDSKGQFCDQGDSYRPAIFPTTKEQADLAMQSKQQVAEKYNMPNLAVEIIPYKEFYDAEDYHQDYYMKHPIRYKYYRWNCGRDARLNSLWNGAERLELFKN